MDEDGDVDFDDFADFAARWMDIGCGLCDGADFTGEGNVDALDLGEFGDSWLAGM
jgi:hypothetical protein